MGEWNNRSECGWEWEWEWNWKYVEVEAEAEVEEEGWEILLQRLEGHATYSTVGSGTIPYSHICAYLPGIHCT